MYRTYRYILGDISDISIYTRRYIRHRYQYMLGDISDISIYTRRYIRHIDIYSAIYRTRRYILGNISDISIYNRRYLFRFVIPNQNMGRLLFFVKMFFTDLETRVTHEIQPPATVLHRWVHRRFRYPNFLYSVASKPVL